MRLALLPLLLLVGACSTPPTRSPELRAKDLARRFVIVDGHVDLPSRLLGQQQGGQPVDDVGQRTGGDFDLPRAFEGGLDAPFLSIYTGAEEAERGTSRQTAEAEIDLVEAIARAHPERCAIARTAADVRALAASGKVALLLGMENGSPAEDDLADLDHFQQRGVRYVTLCHGKDNKICDSSYDTRHTNGGLTAYGRDFVRRMNELGVLVDVSHIDDKSFWQVLEIVRAPVIASHSSLRHFVPGFERNMDDDMVRAVGENGGVVMINFGSSFLTQAANEHGLVERKAVDAFATERGLAPDAPEVQAFHEQYRSEHPFPFADVKDAADHVLRVVELAGVEHVGFGSDFDGVGDSLPTGLKDVSMYPNLIAELLRRGLSEDDVENVCGGNLLRVLEANERLAAELARN